MIFVVYTFQKREFGLYFIREIKLLCTFLSLLINESLRF